MASPEELNPWGIRVRRPRPGGSGSAATAQGATVASKLSSRSLRLGNKELLHTTQLQTALYTKVSGTMRSLAGRCYYFSLKRRIGQHCWRLYTLRPRCSGSDFDPDQSRSRVYLVPLIAYNFKFDLAPCCFEGL